MVTTSDTRHESSAGHVLSGPAWLDAHLAAGGDAYERMLDAAALPTSGRVLDAGCGSGSYLPLLRSRTGPQTQLVAMDLADENVVAVRQRAPDALPLLGSMLQLPFATHSFDAAWCANVLQYLDDAETMTALREMRRVVRPGGTVAIKDVDMTALRICPGPPLLGAHLAEACIRGPDATVQSFGCLRGRELGIWLTRAGFVNVHQTVVPIEYRAPLSDAAALLWKNWLPYLATLAIEKGVPYEDLNVWRQATTPEDAARFIAQPDFYACELQVVASGRVP